MSVMDKIYAAERLWSETGKETNEIVLTQDEYAELYVNWSGRRGITQYAAGINTLEYYAIFGRIKLVYKKGVILQYEDAAEFF